MKVEARRFNAKTSLTKISETAHAAIERQYRILNEEILPKLREEDICFLRRGELTPAQSAWVKIFSGTGCACFNSNQFRSSPSIPAFSQ